MKKQKLTKVQLAKRMKTSRFAHEWLLFMTFNSRDMKQSSHLAVIGPGGTAAANHL